MRRPTPCEHAGLRQRDLLAFSWSSSRSGASAGAPYAPGVVVVDYRNSSSPAAQNAIVHAAGAVGVGGDPILLAPHTRLLTLPQGASVPAAVARLRHTRDVAWAQPDYLAHAAALPGPGAAAGAPAAGNRLTSGATANAAVSDPFPNDPGATTTPDGWQQLQWNFVGEFGVQAPQAWSNLIADHAPGGRGVVVAVLDTGIAYANRGRFRRSPDFYPYQFIKGYDFIDHDPYPNDRNGHGTNVAGGPHALGPHSERDLRPAIMFPHPARSVIAEFPHS
jgi:serine protease